MASLLHRKLLVLTGKGGVGKTTISAALGLIAADRGLRTIVVELGEQHRLAELFGAAPSEAGAQTKLRENLWSVSLDPDRALLEWLQSLGGRVSGRVLASSGTFQYFAAAAPGAKELSSMIAIWKLTKGNSRSTRPGGRGGSYDLVILDAQATGHALGMLHSPQTFGAIARVGPIAAQTRQVGELLSDPARSAYIAVALPTEMAVTEALELRDGLHRQIDRTLDAVVVNGTLPRRFSATEMARIEALDGGRPAGEPARIEAADGGRRSTGEAHSSERGENERGETERGETERGENERGETERGETERGETERDENSAENGAVTRSAALTARAVHDRANFQHNQLARLRRRDFEVHPVPFLFVSELDLAAVQRIAAHLSKHL